MSRKNKTQNVNANKVSNLEAAAAAQPETAPEVPTTDKAEVSTTDEAEVPAAEPTNAVDAAAKELEELKAKMAEAKKKLAEAKKATTKSRPVRMSTFVVRVCLDKTKAIIGEGEQMFKSDVHYCAEKAAIDVLAENIKCGQKNEYVYAICKRFKANEEEETVVELLWTDPETNQIVIE